MFISQDDVSEKIGPSTGTWGCIPGEPEKRTLLLATVEEPVCKGSSFPPSTKHGRELDRGTGPKVSVSSGPEQVLIYDRRYQRTDVALKVAKFRQFESTESHGFRLGRWAPGSVS